MELFVEEAGLVCGGSGGEGFAAGDTNDTKHGQFGEGRAWDEDAVGRRIQIGRCDLDTVIEDGEQVVWDDALDGFSVAVAQADPEAIQFGSAEKGLALWFKLIRELSNEIDRADPGKGNLLVLAVLGEQVDGIRWTEASGVQIAADRLLVGKDNDDFLVSRGWGSVFQRNQFAKDRNGPNLRIIKMYDMLSAFCLSTYCFH